MGLIVEVVLVLYGRITDILFGDFAVSDFRLCVMQGECIDSAEGVGRFFLQVFIDRTSLVVGWVISIAEDTPDITRSFLVNKWSSTPYEPFMYLKYDDDPRVSFHHIAITPIFILMENIRIF
jgi:hypothetical protein